MKITVYHRQNVPPGKIVIKFKNEYYLQKMHIIFIFEKVPGTSH